eukprot:TRINITY_DN8061_c0_g1_i1.p1 TRINITY_DN8061_c0_g1~~TRINITY_DN8061_c0_g1_i1.p1  ORF type:complete len:871 (+),score=274.57 TRINITY_DN8061_c0_g1_i1:203-2815(+)
MYQNDSVNSQQSEKSERDSLTGSHYTIPQMIMSGTLKDGGREGYRACIQRYCILRITRLNIMNSTLSAASLIITVRIEKTKRTLRSVPIDFKPGEPNNLDFCFAFNYLHNLKPPYDILRIALLENNKKKTQREHKLLGYAYVNMAQVLHHPVDEELQLFIPKEKKQEREERKGEREQRKQEKEARKKEKRDLKGGRIAPVLKEDNKGLEAKFDEHTIGSPQQRELEALTRSFSGRNFAVEKPFATMQTSITLYPEEVDSPQDAQEWDDELMDALMVDLRDEVSSDDEDMYDSDESASDGDQDAPNFGPALMLSPTNSGTEKTTEQTLAEQMRSRFRHARDKKQTSRRLNFNYKKYLKLPRGAQQKSHHGEHHEHTEIENDEFKFDKEDISLGASSESSDEEYESSDDMRQYSPPSKRQPSHSVSESYTKPITPNFVSAIEGFSAAISSSPVRKSFTLDTPPPSPNTRHHLVNDINLVFLIDSQKKKGKRLEDCLRYNIDTWKKQVFGVKNTNDIGSIMNALVSHKARATMRDSKDYPLQSSDNLGQSTNQAQNSANNLRLVIAGGDGFLNNILRAFVDITSKKPKGWQEFRFYLIPIGSKNDVAMHLASIDPLYRTLFFTQEWKAFGKSDLNEEQMLDAERRIHRYVDEAQVNFPFQIGEALLNQVSGGTGPAPKVSVPFLKGIQIGVKEAENIGGVPPSPTLEVVENMDLQLDYWIPKKKGEQHKEVKAFQFVAVTRLPAVATALNIEPENKPTASTFSLLVQLKDKSKKERVKDALKLGGKKEEGAPHVSSKISRMLCSLPSEKEKDAAHHTGFKILIDGIEWVGVKFVSLSAEWPSHTKTFPVQIFKPISYTAANASSGSNLVAQKT